MGNKPTSVPSGEAGPLVASSAEKPVLGRSYPPGCKTRGMPTALDMSTHPHRGRRQETMFAVCPLHTKMHPAYLLKITGLPSISPCSTLQTISRELLETNSCTPGNIGGNTTHLGSLWLHRLG